MDSEKSKMEILLADLEASPLTRKIREEREAEILQVRMEAGERLALLKEEAARVLPELLAVENAAREAVAEHDKRRRELEGAIARAATDRAEERLRNERETAAAEAVLLSNYDERIDAAIVFFRGRFDALRLKKPDSDTNNEGTNLFTWTKKRTLRSNYEAIRDALRYCNAAISELERMRLATELDAARIEELKRGIPDTIEMREYSSEKPLPPPPPTEYQLLKLDEQAGTTDYLLGKLNQKIQDWKKGATKSPKASAGKRESSPTPGPSPKRGKEGTLQMYERRNKGYFAAGGTYDYGNSKR